MVGRIYYARLIRIASKHRFEVVNGFTLLRPVSTVWQVNGHGFSHSDAFCING